MPGASPGMTRGRTPTAKGQLMDSLLPENPPVAVPPPVPPRPPRIWKFWGTVLWGFFIFAAMFAGQLAVILWFVLRQEGPFDMAAVIHAVGAGLTISLSVIMGLPAVAAACWIATRVSGTPFIDYLALRWTSPKNFMLGIGALVLMVAAWDLLSRALGREITPGFMSEVLKSAQADDAL